MSHLRRFYTIPPNPMSSNREQQNDPVRVFRASGISVAIFENTSDEGQLFYKMSAQRVYKAGKEFKTSTSFALSEMPTLVLLMIRAWSHASDLESKAKDRAND